jgi:hypothetical protein
MWIDCFANIRMTLSISIIFGTNLSVEESVNGLSNVGNDDDVIENDSGSSA